MTAGEALSLLAVAGLFAGLLALLVWPLRHAPCHHRVWPLPWSTRCHCGYTVRIPHGRSAVVGEAVIGNSTRKALIVHHDRRRRPR